MLRPRRVVLAGCADALLPATSECAAPTEAFWRLLSEAEVAEAVLLPLWDVYTDMLALRTCLRRPPLAAALVLSFTLSFLAASRSNFLPSPCCFVRSFSATC
jgi:hypothetical protein